MLLPKRFITLIVDKLYSVATSVSGTLRGASTDPVTIVHLPLSALQVIPDCNVERDAASLERQTRMHS